MLEIHIHEIAQDRQRYPTSGDWVFDPSGALQVNVSVDPTDNEHQAFLTALHELVEAYLCKARGITTQMVDDFDMGKQEFFAEYGGEPGDDPESPYRKEHRFACIVEHMVAHELVIVGYGKVE